MILKMISQSQKLTWSDTNDQIQHLHRIDKKACDGMLSQISHVAEKSQEIIIKIVIKIDLLDLISVRCVTRE